MRLIGTSCILYLCCIHGYIHRISDCSFTLVIALVAWNCHKQTEYLKTREVYSLKILEAKSLNSRCQAGSSFLAESCLESPQLLVITNHPWCSLGSRFLANLLLHCHMAVVLRICVFLLIRTLVILD